MIDFDNPDELDVKLKDLLDNLDETELLIIKCHLLVEYAMSDFIKNEGSAKSNLSKDGFTFSQKVKICRLLRLFDQDNKMENFILSLNKIRNQISHTMSYDKEQLQELLRSSVVQNKKTGNEDLDIRSQLKATVLFNSGLIIGSSKKRRQKLIEHLSKK